MEYYQMYNVSDEQRMILKLHKYNTIMYYFAIMYWDVCGKKKEVHE